MLKSFAHSLARHRRLAALLHAGAIVTVLTPITGSAQGPEPPRHYAIRDARLVTVSGQTIEQGTIVFEDGLVTAIGANVRVPEGAWVIDGDGLTVYPGLVDALATLGMPASLRAAPRGRGGGAAAGAGTPQEPYSWGPEDRPATFSWVNAADELQTDDDRIEQWRAAGFTSAVVSPERGLFPGQAAFVDLAGVRPRDMVVKTPVALRVNLQSGPGFRGYPASLMGAIAYIKQAFFDAAHYDRAWTIYESAPSGQERPEYDRALEPLRDALNARSYVMLPGVWAREIRRALKVADEVGATAMIYGAHEGYAVASLLAERSVPVLVDVDWPTRPRDADPDADYSLDVLRFRDRAPTTPAVFEEAGVRFAFYSGGLSDPKDVVSNVRKSVALGLSPDAAIRAFTLTPAEMFGVSDRLGSLEAGKIANLVVTDGDLFQDGTAVRMVFVDGKRFDIEAEDAGTVAGGGRNAEEGEEEGGAPTVSPPIPMVQDRGPVRTSRVSVIRNATVMTVSQGTLENASVLIRDGKIAAVGRDIEIPSDAEVIDGTGKYVTPGIIDAHSHIATEAINEGSISVSSMVGIEDVLDPDDIAIYRALAGGVTSVNVLHGSANPIGGENAIIKLRWGADADGLLMEGAPPGIKFALGENVKRDRDPDRYPATRMGVMDVIRQALLDAQAYQREWQEYEALSARQRRTVIPPRRDLKLEPLVEVLEGKRMVHAHCYRADEILQLMRLAEEFGFRIATLQHVLEGYKVADEIAAHGAGASTFSDWWAYKVEAYDAIPYNAALMTQRGVVSSINSDDAEEMRHLNQEAAKAMKWGGLSEDEALKLVTLNPAIQLGVDDRVGSIEVGKDADLTIFDHHPLSVYSVVEQTIIDGQVYFDRQYDLQRREALAQEKQALMDKEKGASETRRPRVTTDIAGH